MFMSGASQPLVFVSLLWFETGSHYADLTGLELTVDQAGFQLTETFLTLPPEN